MMEAKLSITLLNKFPNLQPPRIRGTMSPSELDEWMRELDAIFNTMICLEEYKMGFDYAFIHRGNWSLVGMLLRLVRGGNKANPLA